MVVVIVATIRVLIVVIIGVVVATQIICRGKMTIVLIITVGCEEFDRVRVTTEDTVTLAVMER